MWTPNLLDNLVQIVFILHDSAILDVCIYIGSKLLPVAKEPNRRKTCFVHNDLEIN